MTTFQACQSPILQRLIHTLSEGESPDILIIPAVQTLFVCGSL